MQTDRQTESINTFQLCWKVFKKVLDSPKNFAPGTIIFLPLPWYETGRCGLRHKIYHDEIFFSALYFFFMNYHVFCSRGKSKERQCSSFRELKEKWPLYPPPPVQPKLWIMQISFKYKDTLAECNFDKLDFMLTWRLTLIFLFHSCKFGTLEVLVPGANCSNYSRAVTSLVFFLHNMIKRKGNN